MNKLEIVNYYDILPKKYFGKKKHNPNFNVHHLKLPFRMIICGASGSGKSTLMNIIGALRKAMATCGYMDLKEMQRCEVVVTP